MRRSQKWWRWAVLGLAANSAFGAMQTLEYETDACRCTAQFDSEKFTPKQLNDSISLATGRWAVEQHRYSASFSCTATPKEALPVAADVEKAVNENLDWLRNLKLLPALEPLRADEIRLLELSKHLTLARLAYEKNRRTEELLKDFEGHPIPAQCRDYVGLLKKEEVASLLRAWETLARADCEKQKSQSPTPSSYEACLYNIENSKKQMVDLPTARCSVLTYDWHNCVLRAFHSKPAGDVDDPMAKVRPALKNEKCDCDNTD